MSRPSRPPLLQRPALALAAAVCLLLTAGLMLPTLVQCKFASEDNVCLRLPGLRAWFSVACMLFVMWCGTALTHGWLPRAPRWRPWGLGVQISALTVLGTFVGLVLHRRLAGPEINFSPYSLQVQATIAACACLALEYHDRGRRQQADVEVLRQREQAQARQLDEARAALLQAQVEPHFLFNTLAHLRRLAHTDPRAARGMLAELRHYLAAALPELRQAQTPLARELDLVRAFLALHQRRIGPERLSLRYDIAPGLEDVIVPSTCLLTLAENAVKHGIGPQVAGGEICVRAGPDPDDLGRLRLEVPDTGAGMGSASGGGTGLATLRARLASAYGGAAHLSLHLNQPQGLIARVQLPWL